MVEEETVVVSDEEIKKVEEEIHKKDKSKEEEIAAKVRKEMEQEAEFKKVREEKEALEAKLKEKEEALNKAKEEQKKVLDEEVERRIRDELKQRKATISPEKPKTVRETFDETQVKSIEESSYNAFISQRSR